MYSPCFGSDGTEFSIIILSISLLKNMSSNFDKLVGLFESCSAKGSNFQICLTFRNAHITLVAGKVSRAVFMESEIHFELSCSVNFSIKMPNSLGTAFFSGVDEYTFASTPLPSDFSVVETVVIYIPQIIDSQTRVNADSRVSISLIKPVEYDPLRLV
jgi:hypothetical protein